MANPRPWRHYPKIIERFLSPFEKSITFTISFKLTFHIFLKSTHSSKFIYHHRMINDQIYIGNWVYFFSIFSKLYNRFTHGSEINDSWNSGEILHQNACGTVGNFMIAFFCIKPVSNRMNIFSCYRFAIFKSA